MEYPVQRLQLRREVEPRDSVVSYRALANHLTSGMQRRNRPAVKSYLVERLRSGADRDDAAFLRRTLHRASPRRRLDVVPLAETPTILRAQVGSVVLWIDTADGSFWEVHSLDDSATVGAIVERWIAVTPELDLPWLPEELLRVASGSGDFVGFGLTYSREFFAEDPDTAESLTVRVSGTEAHNALSDLQKQRTFLRTSALSMVRVRNPFAGPGAMTTHRVTASLTARGRVSSRGESFERHRTFFRHCCELYRSAATTIQNELSLGSLSTDGEGLRGPLLIDLGSPIDDLAGFCGRVFSGSDPFRIWGFLERRAADLVVAHAFDRRSGAAFTVEAGPRVWRLFLPSTTPGMVVLRLLTLLQHHHDRRATVPALHLAQKSSSVQRPS
jgi:hypothetical protein